MQRYLAIKIDGMSERTTVSGTTDTLAAGPAGLPGGCRVGCTRQTW